MDIEQKIRDLEQKVNILENSNRTLLNTLSSHTHSGAQDSNKQMRSIDLKYGSIITIGKASITQYTTNDSLSTEENRYIITSGTDIGSGISNKSKNSQIELANQPGTTGSTNQSFYYGFRAPLYTGTSSVTSAGTTLTQTEFSWTVNELAGAHLVILNSSGTFQHDRQIASNTATVITIDGTFPATVNPCTYLVLMPIYLGASQYPWRQIYLGGEDVSSGGTGIQRRIARMGYGTTSGADVIGLYMGTGSPLNVVTANIGSLFLRTDGGAATTLYVKESATDSTGWVAK